MVGIIITGIICLTLIIIAAIGTMSTGETKADRTIYEIDQDCKKTFAQIGKDMVDLKERIERLEDVH